MGYYDTPAQAEAYATMAKDYNGANLIEVLANHLTPGATVLELGMGPGKDLRLLRDAGFQPTGSDASPAFLQRYTDEGGQFPTLALDARTIDTDAQFDCIYSNKVLHHLTRDELSASLARQAAIAGPGGLLMHSFWVGEQVEVFKGMLATHYTEALLDAHTPDGLQRIFCRRYAEMEPADSLMVLWRVG